MTIAIASDHAGFALKTDLVRHLAAAGHQVTDLGPADASSVDYPDTIAPAARAVGRGEVERAVVICGSGIGASIVANKVRGVRCALVGDLYDAEFSRRHNDANVIALGARKLDTARAVAVLATWLDTPFEGGRHAGRVDKITALEQEEGR